MYCLQGQYHNKTYRRKSILVARSDQYAASFRNDRKTNKELRKQTKGKTNSANIDDNTAKTTGTRTLQKFKMSWTAEPDLSCFEPYEKDEYSAWCKICLVKLSIAKGGKANLSKHILGASHIEACGKTKRRTKQL